MAHTIKFLSLQKSELEYEVELRGGVGETVQELRKNIVKLSQQLLSEDILESHLDPSDDLKGVKESLLKSASNLAILKSKYDKNLFIRTENILNHLFHRMNRINVNSDVAEVYKACATNFNTQYKDLLAIRPQTPQQQSSSSTSSHTATNLESMPPITVTCDRNLTSDITKLKYSGKSCVRSFIQKVDEFMQSRGIPDEKILSMAFEIFTEDALHWYRCNKDRAQSWQELCLLLKEDFSSSDYDYRLASEIRSRTQGESENIIIYMSIMQGMFSRLSKPFSEEDKLEILLHNIRPCYASTLAASPGIKSIDSLKSLCRNYEIIQSRFSHFHEPPAVTSSTLAPEFAYKQPSLPSSSDKPRQYNYNHNKTNNYNSSNQNTYSKNYLHPKTTISKPCLNASIPVDAVADSGPLRPMYCPRCRTNDHTLRTCKEVRFLICFKCGKKDVRYTDCPDCNRDSTSKPKN